MKHTFIRSTENVGSAKYVVTYHREGATHKDGSPFHDIAIFTNKKKRDAFIKTLK